MKIVRDRDFLDLEGYVAVEFFDLVGDIDDLGVGESLAFVARAFVDNCSSRTVISKRAVGSLRTALLPQSASYGRRSYPMRLVALRVSARGRMLRALPVVVSDEIIAEVDAGAADVILGRDALQRSRRYR